MECSTPAGSQGDGDHDMVVIPIGENSGETSNSAHEESTSAFAQSESSDAFNAESGARQPWRILSSLVWYGLVYLVLCLKVLQCLPMKYSLTKLSLVVVFVAVSAFACILSLFLFLWDMRRLSQSDGRRIAERAQQMVMALLAGLPMSHGLGDGHGNGSTGVGNSTISREAQDDSDVAVASMVSVDSVRNV